MINKIAKKLNIPQNEITSISIVRKSIDGREKPDIYFVYSENIYSFADAFVINELGLLHLKLINNYSKSEQKSGKTNLLLRRSL